MLICLLNSKFTKIGKNFAWCYLLEESERYLCNLCGVAGASLHSVLSALRLYTSMQGSLLLVEEKTFTENAQVKCLLACCDSLHSLLFQWIAFWGFFNCSNKNNKQKKKKKKIT